MFSSVDDHVRRASHYGKRRDQMWYWWNLVLRRFPHIPLPFRKRIVALSHQPRGWEFYVRIGATDWYVANEIIEEGEYELARKWNAETFHTILDLGANIGLSAKFFAEMSAKAIIKAVEPDDENLDLLGRNIMEDGINRRVFTIRGFVGRESGVAGLDSSSGEWGIKMAPADPNAAVPVYSMQEILRKEPIFDFVDLLKCDVEGTEAELFCDCASWITRIRHAIVETHPPYSAEALANDIQRNGGNLTVVARLKHGPNEVVFLEQKH
jgi:FkbM family methyltransferase